MHQGSDGGQAAHQRQPRHDDAHEQIILAVLPADAVAHVIVLPSSPPAARARGEPARALDPRSPAPAAETIDLTAFAAARVTSRVALIAEQHDSFTPRADPCCARGVEIARLHGVLIFGALLATLVFVHTMIQTSILSVRGGPPHVQPGIMVSWRAPPSPPLAPGAQPGSHAGPRAHWQLASPSCSLADFIALMSCRQGYSDECCASYRPFLEHQCVCDRAAWPWQWIPTDSSSAGWMFNLLKCRYTLAEIASYSGCVDQSSECNPARDHDLRLAIYDRGNLEVFSGGRWGGVCAAGFDKTAADAVCRQLGYDHSDDIFTYNKDADTPIAYAGTRCGGEEVRLEHCQIELGDGGDECADGGGELVGVKCGRLAGRGNAGPEICVYNDNRRQCWNQNDHGATMICGTAGRRLRPGLGPGPPLE